MLGQLGVDRCCNEALISTQAGPAHGRSGVLQLGMGPAHFSHHGTLPSCLSYFSSHTITSPTSRLAGSMSLYTRWILRTHHTDRPETEGCQPSRRAWL